MRAWQIRISTVGRVTLFPDEALRREAVRSLVRVAGRHLICFSIPDTHGHLIVLLADESARRLAKSVRLSWGPLAGAPLEQPWAAPFRSQTHLLEAFEYQLGQNSHHELTASPATWSGNCFADLVGARALPGLQCAALLREALPRYRLRDAYRTVGLPAKPLRPATDDEVSRAGLARLAQAAAAACCAPPGLRGRTASEVRARRAVVAVGTDAEYPRATIARALRVSRSTTSRLGLEEADPAAVEATRLRLSLEDAVARAALAAGAGRSS